MVELQGSPASESFLNGKGLGLEARVLPCPSGVLEPKAHGHKLNSLRWEATEKMRKSAERPRICGGLTDFLSFTYVPRKSLLLDDLRCPTLAYTFVWHTMTSQLSPAYSPGSPCSVLAFSKTLPRCPSLRSQLEHHASCRRSKL